MAHSKKDIARIRKASKGQAGVERTEYFGRPGATPSGWLGGPHTVTKDRRKEASRKACRGRVR